MFGTFDKFYGELFTDGLRTILLQLPHEKILQVLIIAHLLLVWVPSLK